MEVRVNESFYVYLESYKGYDWYLENLDEVLNSDVQPINQDNIIDGQLKSSSFLAFEDDSKSGVNFFSFEISRNSTLEALPTLKFVYKKGNSNDSENDVHAQVHLVADYGKEIRSWFHNDPKKDVIIDKKGGEYDIMVSSNTNNLVTLWGSLSHDETLSSGYSWYLENAEDLESTELIKLIYTGSHVLNRNSVTEYEFGFGMGELPKNEVLPSLIFTYKESQESKEVKYTAIVNLRMENEAIIKINELGDVEKTFNVLKNEIFIVELNSVGYEWNLVNADEVRSSNDIEPMNLNEYNSVPFIRKGTGNNYIGANIYKFKVKETATPGKLQPTLEFFMRTNVNQNGAVGLARPYSASITIKLNKERSEEELYDKSVPVIKYEENDKQIVYVESNTILKITQESNASTGFRWVKENVEEITRSEFIDDIGTSYRSHCSQAIPGCGGDETFMLFQKW
ncbi:hypothetical protein PIROE2DRAFT_62819 [Piromyces sp. E2]|nr:hypothetical protein PIROE2DRAFT_62819 [Piromyces sp. E2]|eukprot:OUM60949.1 hypothetical protein PIROE2DRAFT_62819 [Piromyces sp. E2]